MNNTFPFLPHQRAWIEDLKSGKAQQTNGNLFRKVEGKTFGGSPLPVGFCCLGRICILENLPDQSELTSELGTFEGSNGYLSSDIVLKYRLRDRAGKFKLGVETGKATFVYTLAEMNDCGLYNFQQIAEYIESHPENVFTNLEE